MGSGLTPSTGPATGNVVTQKVFINGTELNNEITVYQLTVNKSFNKISYARIVFADGTVASRDFVLSNDDKFKPGSEIKVQLGFDGHPETVFEGIIIKHGIKIRQVGSSLLMIEAKDKAIKLTGARNSKYFIGKTDKDIITELATGLDTSGVEVTAFTHDQLVQFEASNWDFILTRAEANSMLVFTDDGKLVVKKPTLAVPLFTATYGQNIWEFEAEMDARRQVQSVTGHSWDYTTQTAENSTAGSSDFAETGNLTSTDIGTVLGAVVNLNHSGHLKQEQLQGWADSYALRNKLSKATGRVRIQGNASVKPGSTVTLAGVGNRFNGNVFVSGVMHHYEGSWQTDIQFGWQEEWFYKTEDLMEKPAAGLLPGINGLLIGTVISVTDTEQGGQYRVKVKIPSVTGDEGIWARVATLDAGADRGIYFRMQPEDEVVLGFLSDDPREPIILGCLHSKDKHKSPFADTSDSVQEFGIATKEKLKIIFDDSNKKLTVSVPAGSQEKTLIIDGTNGTMEMKDENQNSIKMDSSGITIDAGPGMVTVKGSTIKLN